MTDELTKTFFDTFGIEPKLNRPCEHLLQNKYCSEDKICRDPYFEPFPYCVGFENCTKDYKTRVWFYPKITDSILLELICILGNTSYFLITDDGLPIDVEGLKKSVLHSLTLQAKIDKNKVLKHQVRTLFEEG